jgi:uncharacterized protein (UPF0262 family)
MNGAEKTDRLVSVTLDDASIGRGAPDIEHERAVAIYDLVEESQFALKAHPGPYRLILSLSERRLVFDVRGDDGNPAIAHALSLTPFARIVKDYQLICDSYHQAIRSGAPSRIEAIDMARRGLHDEAADILRARLKGKVEVDKDTARRLFTLIYVLHLRG